MAVDRRLTGTKGFSNLSRKYKISISGCREQCAVHEIMDVGLVGLARPDGRRGFDLWAGGGLGSNPIFARRLGAFVPPGRAVEVATGITALFRDYGYRRSRTKARMKFLMRDWGPERFRDVLEREYLETSLEDGPAGAASPLAHREHLGPDAAARRARRPGVRPPGGTDLRVAAHPVAQLARRSGAGGSAPLPSRRW